MPQPKRPIDPLTEESLARNNLGTVDAQIYLTWAQGLPHPTERNLWLLYPLGSPAAIAGVMRMDTKLIRIRLEAAKSIMGKAVDAYLLATSMLDVTETRRDVTEKLQYGITVAHGHEAETVIDGVQRAVVEGWELDSLGRRVEK